MDTSDGQRSISGDFLRKTATSPDSLPFFLAFLSAQMSVKAMGATQMGMRMQNIP